VRFPFAVHYSLLIALLLAGCASDIDAPSAETVRAARLYPANYKAELLSYLRTFLNDPNVRNAYVSEPVLVKIQGEERYVNCVRFDAKAASGGYRGDRDHVARYFGGKLEYFQELRPETKDDRCRNADYQSFPELEQLGRTAGPTASRR
jgi:hypothetical protein